MMKQFLHGISPDQEEMQNITLCIKKKKPLQIQKARGFKITKSTTCIQLAQTLSQFHLKNYEP